MAFKVVSNYLIFSIIVEFFGFFVRKIHFNNGNNNFIYNFYILYDFAFNFLIFDVLSKTNYRKYTALLFWGFSLFWIYNIFINGIIASVTMALGLGTFINVLLYLILIYDISLKNPVSSLRFEPSFWLSISVIFFYGCSVFDLATQDVQEGLSQSQSSFLNYFLLILNYIRYGLIFYAFFLFYTNKKKVSIQNHES